jgi:hypothetical protein
MTPELTTVMLPPEALLADDNSRFGLRKERIESLMDDILDKGGVMVPLEVEPLPEDNVLAATTPYRVTDGHYRHAAVIRLNKEKGAGLVLPCVVVAPGDSTKRLKRQISINYERQDLTPIDTAVAIKRLLDAGVSKMEVREIFKRAGGRKGNKVQPASNSFVNIMLSFLEFPLAIQNKLHNGDLNVGGGMQLYKVFQKDPSKLKEVVADMEAEREKEAEDEEKLEEKYLAQVKKEEEAKATLEKVAKELEAAKSAVQEKSAALDAAAELETEKYKLTKNIHLGDDERAKFEADFKVAEAATVAANKEAMAAKKAKEALEEKLKKANEQAEERRLRLEGLRKENAKKAKKKAAGARDVDKAAKKSGVELNAVPLKLADIRTCVHDLSTPGNYPKVQAIGIAFRDYFQGHGTDKDLAKTLARITGELVDKKAEKEAAKKAAESKAAAPATAEVPATA